MSPHCDNMIMQFKNKLICFIVTTEQRNIKIYHRVCGVLNTSVANRDVVEQGAHTVLAFSYFQNDQVKMIYLHKKY